jgi:hypothetical protein
MTEADSSKPEPPRQERDEAVPRPPSDKDIRDISEQQGLITDEWTGEGSGQR